MHSWKRASTIWFQFRPFCRGSQGGWLPLRKRGSDSNSRLCPRYNFKMGCLGQPVQCHRWRKPLTLTYLPFALPTMDLAAASYSLSSINVVRKDKSFQHSRWPTQWRPISSGDLNENSLIRNSTEDDVLCLEITQTLVPICRSVPLYNHPMNIIILHGMLRNNFQNPLLAPPGLLRVISLSFRPVLLRTTNSIVAAAHCRVPPSPRISKTVNIGLDIFRFPAHAPAIFNKIVIDNSCSVDIFSIVDT